MTETLPAFIARRRFELLEEEAALRRRLQEISLERESLDRAESATFSQGNIEKEHISSSIKRTRSIKKGTIMDEVVSILNRNPQGMTANQILFEINIKKETDFLARTSLSPQLSRLRQAGYIELDGSTWRLAKPEQTNEKG